MNKPEKATSKESSAIPSKTLDPQRSNEVRSGFFVVLCALTLLVLLFLSGQSQLLQGTKTYKISYNYIGGLAENAPVHFAGHKVGKVTKIDFTGNPEGAVEVEISINKKVVLRKDSQAYIDALGLMGEKYIELSVGTAAAEVVKENEFVHGTDPVPMMEIVKKGTEILEQFHKTGDEMEGLLGNLKAIVGDNQDELDGMLKNAYSISGNLDGMSANLKDMSHDLKLHPWKLLRKSNPPAEENKDKKKKRFFFF